jgi:phosphatidate phosphatase APP1
MEEGSLPPVRLSDQLDSGRDLLATAISEAPIMNRHARRWLAATFEARAADAAGALVGALVTARTRITGAGPLTIETYRGFGTRDRAWLTGRVVAGLPNPPAHADLLAWQNILRTAGDLLVYGVPDARVRVHLGASTNVAVTDAQGYFNLELRRHGAEQTAEWAHGQVELVDCPLPGKMPAPATVEILVPHVAARCAFISDIDDTIVESHTDGWLRMAWVALAGNALTRRSIEGTAAFYRALVTGPGGTEHNPLFYVSRSPWNLYPFLSAFLEQQGLPRGPLCLRGLGRRQARPDTFKGDAIERLIGAYPHLGFVLLGDGAENDLDVYLDVARRQPGRVHTIYIRDPAGRLPRLSLDARRHEARRAGSELVVFEHVAQAAAHARAAGMVAPL